MSKAIAVRNLRPGMEVIALDCPWEQIPFWDGPFVIETADDIIRLSNYCDKVMVDSKEKSEPVQATKPQIPTDQPASHEITASQQTEATAHHDSKDSRCKNFKDELKQQRVEKLNKVKAKVTPEYAQSSVEETRLELEEMFSDIRTGGSVHTKELYDAVQHILISSIAQPEVLAMMNHISPKTGTLAQKSTDVCIWSLLFGRRLGMNKEQLIQIGLGALLHDIGMLKVPDSLLSNKGILSVGQRLMIQQHVEDGRALIGRDESLKQIDAMVAYHHERYDGTGYPTGIRGKRIPLMARILSIVMAYEAMTRDRLYKPSDNPTQALSQLYRLRNKHFEGALVERFIACVGVYPIGTLVQLSDLTIALVTETHPDKRSQPIVKRILSPDLEVIEADTPVDLCLKGCNVKVLRAVEPAELPEEVITSIHHLMRLHTPVNLTDYQLTG